MKTEEHVIIILTVWEENNTININYTATSDQGNVNLKVTNVDGKVVQSFENVEKAENATLSFSAVGMQPGAYTCSIELNGKIKGSKQFQIER